MNKFEIKQELILKAAEFPGIKGMLEKAQPLSLPRRSITSADLHLARSIIGQQLSVKAARCIWQKAEPILDSHIRNEEFYDHLIQHLPGCGVSKFKVKAIVEVFKFFQSNQNIGNHLSQFSHIERSEILCTIWGVGQWTVDMASIFYFRDKDIWPLSDAGLQKSLSMITKDMQKFNMLEIGKRFSPYRSYLSLYLWDYLDNKP